MDELVKRLRDRAKAFDYDGWVETASDYEKAADAIEKLSRKYIEERNAAVELNGELASKPSWIPVTERLPEQKKLVLVTGIEAIGNVRIYGVKQLDGDVWRPTSAPSCYWEHWMPLPEPPKEE